MAEIDVQGAVTGDREITAGMDLVRQSLTVKLREAVTAAGQEVRDEASRRAPTRSGKQSKTSKRLGPLWRQIRARYSEKPGLFRSTVDMGDAFYGRFLEHGMPWKSKRILVVGYKMRRQSRYDSRTGKKRRTRVYSGHGFWRTAPDYPARPFLGTAYVAKEPNVKARIQNALREALGGR